MACLMARETARPSVVALGPLWARWKALAKDWASASALGSESAVPLERGSAQGLGCGWALALGAPMAPATAWPSVPEKAAPWVGRLAPAMALATDFCSAPVLGESWGGDSEAR